MKIKSDYSVNERKYLIIKYAGKNIKEIMVLGEEEFVKEIRKIHDNLPNSNERMLLDVTKNPDVLIRFIEKDLNFEGSEKQIHLYRIENRGEARRFE